MTPLPVWNAPAYGGYGGKEGGMVTPDGPACDHCSALLPGGYGYVSFFFCHLICCSVECLEAAEEERKRAFRAEEYLMERHGRRNWKVVDGNGELVCVAVYKKGAAEVIRRLKRRKPPRFRSHAGRLVRKDMPATDTLPTASADRNARTRTKAA